ncbi:uncharacterized protein LOC115875416 isoform X2 [Sitophilus oryzae]|uniref:Uncharacterized protein LOC115875416 isoform X2 n=1 Tax=Sitophilus oryzae TaxID=7048 RepID=A0A6J2X6D8_SITOR|nr:uncharacterized protein LOC115875416 isoform X2 [Sitophilus oryzae]
MEVDLYNYHLKDHHNRELRDALWDEIALEMKAPVADCKTKWNSLRNSYARQLREIKNNPIGAASSKKKIWYLFDSMSFLKDFMSQHKKMRSSNYDEPTILKTNNINNDVYENMVDFESSNSQFSISSPPPISCELNPPRKSKDVSKKHCKESATDRVAESMVAFLKSKTEQTEEKLNASDLNFFKSLIPDMQKLSSKRHRQFKAEIMLSLNKLLDEEEEEIARNSSSSSMAQDQT